MQPTDRQQQQLCHEVQSFTKNNFYEQAVKVIMCFGSGFFFLYFLYELFLLLFLWLQTLHEHEGHFSHLGFFSCMFVYITNTCKKYLRPAKIVIREGRNTYYNYLGCQKIVAINKH